MAELDDDDLKDWKLKLRYGRLVTPYVHRTLIADVTVHETTEVNNAPPGPELEDAIEFGSITTKPYF